MFRSPTLSFWCASSNWRDYLLSICIGRLRNWHTILKIQLLNHCSMCPGQVASWVLALVEHFSLKLPIYQSDRIEASLTGHVRHEGHSSYAPHPYLPLCKIAKSRVSPKGRTVEIRICLKSRRFQLRRSEQGFAKSSAFKLYRFHFISQVTGFPVYWRDNRQFPVRLFFSQVILTSFHGGKFGVNCSELDLDQVY